MYIDGRRRTASRPSSTSMSLARYLLLTRVVIEAFFDFAMFGYFYSSSISAQSTNSMGGRMTSKNSFRRLVRTPLPPRDVTLYFV